MQSLLYWCGVRLALLPLQYSRRCPVSRRVVPDGLAKPADRWLDAQSHWLVTLDSTWITYGRLPYLTNRLALDEWLLL